VHNLARSNGLEAGSKREKKGGVDRRNARVSRARNRSRFTTPTSRAAGAVQSALGAGGCDPELFFSVTCSLHFTKADSATTLPQQEKYN
jgi:hypothetical protein